MFSEKNQKRYIVTLILRDEDGLYNYHLDRLLTILNDIGQARVLEKKQILLTCIGFQCINALLVKIEVFMNFSDLSLSLAGFQYVKLGKINPFIDKVVDIEIISIIEAEENRPLFYDYEQHKKSGADTRIKLERKLSNVAIKRLYTIESELINTALKYDDLALMSLD